MQTWVSLKFADGEYLFRFGIEQIAELEKKCADGIGAIYARTLRGRYGDLVENVLPTEGAYRFNELVEIIRQGLIGGKTGRVDGIDVVVTPIRANELVERYVFGTGYSRAALRETWALAAFILAALIEGYEPPKDDAGENPATPAQGSTS